MKVRCAECGFVFTGRVPKGGDGSLLVPVWHKRWQERGTGREVRVPCEGRFDECKEVLQEIS